MSKLRTRQTRAERRLQALELRKAGRSYAEIARLLKSTASTVAKWVREEMERAEEKTLGLVEDVRALELERLDALLAGVWDEAKEGKTRSVSAALSILERRSKLLGLDAPTQTQVGVASFVDLARAIEVESETVTTTLDLPPLPPVEVEVEVAPEQEPELTSLAWRVELREDGAAYLDVDVVEVEVEAGG